MNWDQIRKEVLAKYSTHCEIELVRRTITAGDPPLVHIGWLPITEWAPGWGPVREWSHSQRARRAGAEIEVEFFAIKNGDPGEAPIPGERVARIPAELLDHPWRGRISQQTFMGYDGMMRIERHEIDAAGWYLAPVPLR